MQHHAPKWTRRPRGFPKNQREQRKAELDQRIGDLELRKAEAMAAYDLAIERNARNWKR